MDILTINDTPGQHPSSWYAATSTPPGPFAPARGKIRADLCIVGGGYTGLSAALHAARAGLSVVLLEASRLGSGASGRNGGQVGTGQRLDQHELESLVGPARARVLWDYAQDAVGLVESLIREGIDCDYRSGVLHVNHRARFDPHSQGYADHLRTRYGYDKIRFLDRSALRAELGTEAYTGGTLDMGSGHLHPLRYAFGLARLAALAGAQLHETSRVTRIETAGRPRVCTDQAEIEAGHLILAMNGYHNNLVPEVARRVMPINNFIVATEPLPQALTDELIPNRYAVADSRFVINYFRLSADNRMLFGGGESYGYRFPAEIAAKAGRPMREIFPQLAKTKIDYAWGGTLGITMSRLPHFARLGPAAMSCAGFSGQGVALATWAGRIAACAAQGQAERFDTMQALPTPRFPGGPGLRAPLLAAAMTWYGLRDRL